MKGKRMVMQIERFVRSFLRNPANLQALLGTAAGTAIMVAFGLFKVPATAAEVLFWVFHPIRIFLCAQMTMEYLRAGKREFDVKAAAFDFVFSLLAVTLTDSIITFLGEFLLQLPSRHFHIGFLEMWWLVNPAAIAGIVVASWKPGIRIPSVFIVLMTAMAPLFDMLMAMWTVLSPVPVVVTALFLFLSVRAYFYAMSDLLPILRKRLGLE
jgi:hypothetical protein